MRDGAVKDGEDLLSCGLFGIEGSGHGIEVQLNLKLYALTRHGVPFVELVIIVYEICASQKQKSLLGTSELRGGAFSC